MARLALSPVGASRNGVDVTIAALTALGANTGVQFANNGNMLLVVQNGNAASCVLTYNVSPLVEPESAVPAAAQMPIATIPTAKYYVLGPFSNKNYKQADGNMYIDFSVQSSVVVGLINVASLALA